MSSLLCVAFSLAQVTCSVSAKASTRHTIERRQTVSKRKSTKPKTKKQTKKIKKSSKPPQNNLQDLEKKQNSITKEEAALNKKLENIKNGITTKENFQKEIGNEIKNLDKKIEEEKEKIDKFQSKLDKKQTDIDNIQADVDELYFQLKKRVLTIYKSGDATFLEMFFEAKNLEELWENAKLVQLLSEHDANIIDSLNANIEKINVEKTTIEQDKIQIETLKVKLDSSKKNLEKAERENKRSIANLKHSQSQTESRLKQIAKEKQQLEEQISKFHEEYIKQQAASGENKNYRKGRYVWPTPQCHVVTSPFGKKRGRRIHQGMDIAGGRAHGTPIVAACDGVVIKANKTNRWGSGWGYYVMIDHGDGYATLYAHCSSINVSVGQHVKAGQTIAKVGNTGHSHGAHLHFEAWHNGKRYNPTVEFK